MTFDFFDSPELLDVQRTGFYDFLNQGIPQLLSKEFPIKVENDSYSLSLCLNEKNVKLIAPEDDPRDCILKMKSYNCKLYAQVQIVCRKLSPSLYPFSENKERIVYQSLPEWVLLGQLPMMTKRGHFIINGSPRVIVHQVVRAPGIYFQKLVKKDDQNKARFYGDIIPLKGVWVRLQMTKKGRVEAKFKKGKKVEVELLQKCLQVIENLVLTKQSFVSEALSGLQSGALYATRPEQSSALLGQSSYTLPLQLQGFCLQSSAYNYKLHRRFSSTCKPHRTLGGKAPSVFRQLIANPKDPRFFVYDEYAKLLDKKKSRAESNAEHDAFVHTYDKLYRTSQDKELEEWQKKKKNLSFFKGRGSKPSNEGLSNEMVKKSSLCDTSLNKACTYKARTKLRFVDKCKAMPTITNRRFVRSFVSKKICNCMPSIVNRNHSIAPPARGMQLQNFVLLERLYAQNGNSLGHAQEIFRPAGKNLSSKNKKTVSSKFDLSSNGTSVHLHEDSPYRSKPGVKVGAPSQDQGFGLSLSPESSFKRKKCSENLFATFKIQSRYDLGLLGREKINNRLGLQSYALDAYNYKAAHTKPKAVSSKTVAEDGLVQSFSSFLQGQKRVQLRKRCKAHKAYKASYKSSCLQSRALSAKLCTCICKGNESSNTQLTALDLCSASLWLYKLRKGEQSTDDIDHSQNRRVRTSGELLQNQFENGVYRLRVLLSTKLQEWRGCSVFSSMVKSSCKTGYRCKKASFKKLKHTEKKSFTAPLLNSRLNLPALKPFEKAKAAKVEQKRPNLLTGLTGAVTSFGGVNRPSPKPYFVSKYSYKTARTFASFCFTYRASYKSSCKASEKACTKLRFVKLSQKLCKKICKAKLIGTSVVTKLLTNTNLVQSSLQILYKTLFCKQLQLLTITNRRFVRSFVSEALLTKQSFVQDLSEALHLYLSGLQSYALYATCPFGQRFVRSFVTRVQSSALLTKPSSVCPIQPLYVRSFASANLVRDQKFVRDQSNKASYTFCAKELFSTKPITGALREFFGSNPLSQYMDQTNPLAEVTHKRRISSLGVGGVSRESAGMAIRGIHPTHYGRICPIETPEGKNAGLVNSLAFYTKVDKDGFLKTPYYRVFKGQVQSSLGFSFCSAKEESVTGLQIAPSDLQKSSNNILRTRLSTTESVPVRVANNLLDIFKKEKPYKVQLIAISPIQMISVATSLIPFLEHNDANRALMGSNMQRQAVPLMISERAVVGTGLESRVIVESGHVTESQISGFASHVTANKIVVDSLHYKGKGGFSRSAYNAYNYKCNYKVANKALYAELCTSLQSRALYKLCKPSLLLKQKSFVTLQTKKWGTDGVYLAQKRCNPYSRTKTALCNCRAYRARLFTTCNALRRKMPPGNVHPSLFVLHPKAFLQALHARFCKPYNKTLHKPELVHPAVRFKRYDLAPAYKAHNRLFRSTLDYFCGVENAKTTGLLAFAEGEKPQEGTRESWPAFHVPLYRPQSSSLLQGKPLSRGGKAMQLQPSLGYLCTRYTKKQSVLLSTVSPLTSFSRSNQNSCITEKPLVREFDWVQKGDVLSDCSASNNGELAVGKNVLLAYIPWEGYNFEDAIVISERLVKEHVYTSLHIERYVFQAQDLKDGNEWFTNQLPGVEPRLIQHLEESGLPKIGSFLKEGEIIVGKIRYLNKKPSSPYERLLCDILGEKNFAARNKSLYVPKGVEARVIYHKVISLFDNDPENKIRPMESAKTVHLFLGERRVIQVGDKISGRHGNKGVISTILPRQDMPYLPDGTPIDIVLNPLGVPSRMNVGQVLECLLGLAATYLNQHFKIEAFDERYGVEASKSIVFLKLYQARLLSGQNWLFQVSFPGKTRLVDGRSGECFDQWITVGRAYILKLIHMVSEKIHARSTGPYALITQQPLRGRSNKGGQRLGEMEVWALEGFGAAYTLQELLTKKSDDFFGRKQIVDSILPNPASIVDTLKPSNRIDQNKNVLGHPEIFKVLLCELQALCLDLGVYIVTPDSFQRSFLGIVH